MSSSLAGPSPVRGPVRSMITVTYLSPRRVCLHTRSSTPIVVTPSNRCGSSISTRLPSARTASFAVFQLTASPSAIRATVRCCTTIPSSAHRSPRRDSLALGSAAFVMSWRHTWQQSAHRYRRTSTSSTVGRQPSGSCASRRTTVSRSTPRPHRWHQSSGSTTRQAITARCGSTRCPAATRPSSSSRQKVVRSGAAKVASGTSRSSRWFGVRTSILRRPRPLPGDRRAARDHTPPTPPIVMSLITSGGGLRQMSPCDWTRHPFKPRKPSSTPWLRPECSLKR